MPQLSAFGLPIHPIGDGSVTALDGWSEFLDESFALNAESVSVWRLGNVEPGILELLKATPPRPISYTVQPGDNLTSLADRWGVDVQSIVDTNGIANPNLISIGQQIVVPRSGRACAHVAAPATAPSGQTYTVEWGDSLWGLAERWGTTVEDVAAVNDITDTSLIRVGDTLIIP